MTFDISDEARLLERLRTARGKGVQWLLNHIDDDGRAVGADVRNTYYRLPWTLSLAGEPGVAARVLSWIEREALDATGDLRPGPAQEPNIHRWASYPLAIIALGAWRLERYATAQRILDTLERFQDPATGGAYTERPEVRASARQDLFPTAQLGMTALATGRMEVAHAAFRWVTALYDAQPDLPQRLYTGWDEGGLITVAETPSEAFELITDLTKPRQCFFNPGIAAAFCGRYCAATGDDEARELGRALLRLSADGTPAQFDFSESRQICKFGWGAAAMLEVDPEGGHRRHVERMAHWFCASQEPDGHWVNSPFLEPDPSPMSRLVTTSEFVLHVCTILAALEGSGPSDATAASPTRRAQAAAGGRA
jgi:hypothetical protein